MHLLVYYMHCIIIIAELASYILVSVGQYYIVTVIV